MSLVTNKSWEHNGGVLRFGVMDLREAPRQKASKVSTSSAPLLPFMNSMAQQMDPKMDTPSVWLWIVGDSLDMETVTNYIASDM